MLHVITLVLAIAGLVSLSPSSRYRLACEETTRLVIAPLLLVTASVITFVTVVCIFCTRSNRLLSRMRHRQRTKDADATGDQEVKEATDVTTATNEAISEKIRRAPSRLLAKVRTPKPTIIVTSGVASNETNIATEIDIHDTNTELGTVPQPVALPVAQPVAVPTTSSTSASPSRFNKLRGHVTSGVGAARSKLKQMTTKQQRNTDTASAPDDLDNASIDASLADSGEGW
jgi:uncharacterized membrane protein